MLGIVPSLNCQPLKVKYWSVPSTNLRLSPGVKVYVWPAPIRSVCSRVNEGWLLRVTVMFCMPVVALIVKLKLFGIGVLDGFTVGVGLTMVLLVASNRHVYAPELGVVDKVRTKVLCSYAFSANTVLFWLHVWVVPSGSVVKSIRL